MVRQKVVVLGDSQYSVSVDPTIDRKDAVVSGREVLDPDVLQVPNNMTRGVP